MTRLLRPLRDPWFLVLVAGLLIIGARAVFSPAIFAALPNKVDPTSPADTDLVSAGAGQIRGVKQYLVDVFGLPNNANVTAAATSISTAGVVTVSQAGFTTASTAAIGTPSVLTNAMLTVHGALGFSANGLTPSGPAIQASGSLLNLLAGTSGGVGITTSGATIPTSGSGQLQVWQDTNSSQTITAIARANTATDYNALEFRQANGTVLANVWNAAGGADPLRIKATNGVQLHTGTAYSNAGLVFSALASGVTIAGNLQLTVVGGSAMNTYLTAAGDIGIRSGLSFSFMPSNATEGLPGLFLQNSGAAGMRTTSPAGLFHLAGACDRCLTFSKNAAGTPASGTQNTVSLRVVPGTNPSTCRLEAVAGNATNVYTLQDNIAGC